MPAIKIKYPDGDPATFTSIAALADAYGDIREQRLAQEKIAEALKERESTLSAYLIDNVGKGDATGVRGKLWGIVIKTKTVVQVKDWDAYWSWIFKTKRTDLVQRRVSDGAIKEIWEHNASLPASKQIDVPGVERVEVPTVSLSKVK